MTRPAVAAADGVAAGHGMMEVSGGCEGTQPLSPPFTYIYIPLLCPVPPDSFCLAFAQELPVIPAAACCSHDTVGKYHAYHTS